MKFLSILILTFALLIPKPAHAVDGAKGVRILFSNSNVTTSAWLTLIGQTAKAIKGISVYNSSPVPLELAIGASNSESVQLVLPANNQVAGATNQNPVANFYPLPISQGQKIAIRALNSNGTTGEINMNAFYY